MSNSAPNVKKVLFVDDNRDFLEIIERLMGEWCKGEWQIFLAENASKALVILQEHSIDLAVVDVQMPVVDGIQFLALINRKYPSVQKVTLSAYSDDASRAACISHGAELFLEKPRNPADLELIFATLRELARHKANADGFRGVLRQVSLNDVIQMECLNRNSSVLEVKTGALLGKIFIREGSIIHAEIADRNGEAALNKILCFTRGEFGLQPFTEPPRQTIDGPWEFLVMEAARARDEGGMAEEEAETILPTEPVLPMPKPAPPLRPPADTVVPPAPAPVGTPKPPPSPAPFPTAPQVAPRPTPSAPPGAARSSTPTVAPRPPKPQATRPARAEELVVCSEAGEVLYEWQSTSAVERMELLEFFSQKSRLLGDALQLGQFDRLEIEGRHTRVIAQVKKDRRIFLRAGKTPESLTT